MLNFILGSNIIIFIFFQQVIVHSRAGEKRNKSEPIIRLNHNISWLNLIFFYTKQQAKAEEEEEFISNTLLKKIQSLKKEKETLAMNYEQEEEFLTNDLSRKLMQVPIS